MLRLRVFRLLTILLYFVPSAWGAPNLIENGDFEAKDMGGWEYAGENDASHGVFSEPTRPGTLVYLLQLDGENGEGFSSIRQDVKVERGKIYRLTMEVYDSVAETSAKLEDFQAARIDGAYVFTHYIARGKSRSGWTEYSALFRAQSDQASLEIGVYGPGTDREASTTAIDNVRLELAEEPLREPLRRGAPIAPVRHRESVPSSVILTEDVPFHATYVSLDRYRNLAGHYPALCTITTTWRPGEPAADSVARLLPQLNALARRGVVPIIAIPPAPEIVDPVLKGHLDNYFTVWATALKEWNYPVLIRPWHGMESHLSRYDNPTRFIEMWRRVHNIFGSLDADNVLWFWTPETLSDEARHYYPGHVYVDIVGTSLLPHQGTYALDLHYDQFLRFFRRKAFAIAEAAPGETDPAVFLSAFFAQSVLEYPRIEFFTLRFSLDDPEPLLPPWRVWLDSGFIQHRLPQLGASE